MQENKIQSMQTKLDHCETDNQGKVILEKELDSCRNELTEEQNLKEQLSRNLQSAKGNIKTLQNQLKSEKSRK